MAAAAQKRVLRDTSAQTPAKTPEQQLQALLAQHPELANKFQHDGKETRITVTEFKGRPMFNFEGAFRPFQVSFGKAARILDHVDVLKPLIDANAKKAGKS